MSEEAVPPPRMRRGLVLAAAVTGVVAAALLAFNLLTGSGDEPVRIGERDSAVVDLLSWLPATDETRRAYAAWVEDDVNSTPSPSSVPVDPTLQLGLEPRPRVLGTSRTWDGRFGWSATDVTGWATGGRNAEIAVLQGEFDQDLIAERLESAGYERFTYRGVPVYQLEPIANPGMMVDGDDEAAANVVALAGGRLIAGRDGSLVRAAIDRAIDGTGSVADEAAVATQVSRLAPVTGLVGTDLADLLPGCHPDLSTTGEPAGRYVLVVYGQLGIGGERRTTVVTTYADEAAAAADLPRAEAGWLTGVVSASGAGGTVQAFGDVANVGQAGSAVVVTLINGRDDGWVRAGIRYASPTCDLVASSTTVATPVPVTLTMYERALALLGDPGTDGRFVAVDFAALADARAIAVPGDPLAADELGAWWSGSAPLPSLTAFPNDVIAVQEWAAAFRIAPADIDVVAEMTGSAAVATVGVMIGRWDGQVLHDVLRARGYEWITIGEVTHYGHRSLATESPWRNIAVAGDVLWFSSDQRLMRETIEVALGERVPELADEPLVAPLLPFAEGTTAFEIDGAEFDRQRCRSARGDASGALVSWTAGTEIGIAAVLGGPDAGDVGGSLEELAPMLASWTVSTSATPVASGGEGDIRMPLVFLGVEVQNLQAGQLAVARFQPESGALPPAWFFANAAGGCRLTR